MPQLVSLPRLQRLRLFGFNCAADAIGSLSCLTGLTHLALSLNFEISPPSTLAHLSALRLLRIDCHNLQTGQLAAVLPELPQLTCLAVTTQRLVLPHIAGLAQLSQLQQLWWLTTYAGVPPGLPEQHSLHGIRLLALDWETAIRSVPALAAMPVLAELRLCEVPSVDDVPPVRWEAFWAFVRQHLPLWRLHLTCSKYHLAAAAALQCAPEWAGQPGLLVKFENYKPVSNVLDDLDEA